jgi:hypothetical protein
MEERIRLKSGKYALRNKDKIIKKILQIKDSIIEEIMNSFPKTIDDVPLPEKRYTLREDGTYSEYFPTGSPRDFYVRSDFFNDDEDIDKYFEIMKTEMRKSLMGGVIMRVMDITGDEIEIIIKGKRGIGHYWTWDDYDLAICRGDFENDIAFYCSIVFEEENLRNAINFRGSVEGNFEWGFSDNEIQLNEGTELNLLRIVSESCREDRVKTDIDYSNKNIKIFV